MEQEMASYRRADTDFGEGRARRADAAGGEGVLCAKVMTNEQVEVLRRQIAAYASICEQLMEMHRVFTAHQDSLAGMRFGSLYSDSMVDQGGRRITPRQRWSPTTKQLQMLENIFDQGNGTPSKQTIRDITLELSQHGQISETNVYNWFQNRRARSKRKQMAQSNPESEAEADYESPSEKKPKMDSFETQQVKVDNYLIYNAQVIDKVLLRGQEVNQTQSMHRSSESSKSSAISGEMYYKNLLPSQRVDQWREKTASPGSFSTFHSGKNYGVIS